MLETPIRFTPVRLVDGTIDLNVELDLHLAVLDLFTNHGQSELETFGNGDRLQNGLGRFRIRAR